MKVVVFYHSFQSTMLKCKGGLCLENVGYVHYEEFKNVIIQCLKGLLRSIFLLFNTQVIQQT